MATFDQLAADQRAIIEIVLRQGRSYEQIGEMLDLPPARVRELARDALGELAPFTAEFVDAQWRGQLADYVLGQQTGPEAQATRGHLRRSEPARIWAYSLLDALDDFYADTERPEIPVGDAGSPSRSRARDRVTAAAADETAENGEAPSRSLASPRRSSGALSPAARSALMRRRIAGGVIGALLLALVVFGATKIFGGDDNKPKKAAAAKTSTTAGNSQGQVVAQAILAPIGGTKAQGAAFVYATQKQAVALVRAKFPPSS